MAFKQDANGSLTSCQICHTLYYKARTKITYALARRGFPVAVRGKRAEYWAIFDISILLLAVALGYISAQETLHCHRGGRKGEGESRDGNGSREGRIFRWLEGGQGSDWITAIRILIKFNLPPSSFLPHGWQVAGNHENRHSSLWAQGESPITLQLIGGKKKKLCIDGWMLKGSMSSLPWPQEGNARDSGRVLADGGQSQPWGRTAEAERKGHSRILHQIEDKASLKWKEVWKPVSLQEKQRVGRDYGQKRWMVYPLRSYIKPFSTSSFPGCNQRKKLLTAAKKWYLL